MTAAQGLAEQGEFTGLRHQRGWRCVLARETERCHSHGLPATVLLIDVDGAHLGGEPGHPGNGDGLVRRTADVLTQASRPVDIVARLGQTQLLVLAIQCDAYGAKALTKRIRMSLRSAGIAASVGSATRRLGEDLTETQQRAAEAMALEQRRRRRLVDARERRAQPYA